MAQQLQLTEISKAYQDKAMSRPWEADHREVIVSLLTHSNATEARWLLSQPRQSAAAEVQVSSTDSSASTCLLQLCADRLSAVGQQ